MATYKVTVLAIYSQEILIEACSPKQAKDKIVKGGGAPIKNSLKLVNTLVEQNWKVEEDGGLFGNG